MFKPSPGQPLDPARRAAGGTRGRVERVRRRIAGDRVERDRGLWLSGWIQAIEPDDRLLATHAGLSSRDTTSSWSSARYVVPSPSVCVTVVVASAENGAFATTRSDSAPAYDCDRRRPEPECGPLSGRPVRRPGCSSPIPRGTRGLPNGNASWCLLLSWGPASTGLDLNYLDESHRARQAVVADHHIRQHVR